MNRSSKKLPMERVQGRLPLPLFRQFTSFCEEQQMDQSEALRVLLTKALSGKTLIEELSTVIQQEHQMSREETRQLTALFLGNIAATKSPDSEMVYEMIDRAVAHAHRVVEREERNVIDRDDSR